MRYAIMGVLALITIAQVFVLPARADEAQPVPTVENTYLGLSMGALQDARLTSLPEGMVLRAGAVTITEQQVKAEITRAKPERRASFPKNRFFLLEQIAIKSLLLEEARTWATDTEWAGKPEDERSLISAYLTTGIADTVVVTDDEVRAFYQQNKAMMGDVAFDSVVNELRTFLLDEKRQQAIDRHVQTMSERMTVEVDAAWTAAQAKTALNNPVDRARRAARPAVIEFGAEGCQACEMMKPILTSLQEMYDQQCAILSINVQHEPILGARYGIESVPVQIFFDKDGREVFRHVGYFTKAEMLEQLAKLGVQ